MAPPNMRGGVQARPIDDQSLNSRLRMLQQQKREIAQLAQKYELEDNSKIGELSYLTLMNSKKGHHHHATAPGGGSPTKNLDNLEA